MAFQAKRKKIYEEEFQLTEEDGTVVTTLRVALDADSMVKKLSEKHTALVKALELVRRVSTQEDVSDGVEILGNAVVDMLEAVFGECDTKIIVEFYNNRYLEMCQEVMPFITEIVIPNVRKISQANKKDVLITYSRGQRRKMKFGKK
ncbi:MAG: hypothetical protein RR875_00100 [Clostridium sp.]